MDNKKCLTEEQLQKINGGNKDVSAQMGNNPHCIDCGFGLNTIGQQGTLLLCNCPLCGKMYLGATSSGTWTLLE